MTKKLAHKFQMNKPDTLERINAKIAKAQEAVRRQQQVFLPLPPLNEFSDVAALVKEADSLLLKPSKPVKGSNSSKKCEKRTLVRKCIKNIIYEERDKAIYALKVHKIKNPRYLIHLERKTTAEKNLKKQGKLELYNEIASPMPICDKYVLKDVDLAKELNKLAQRHYTQELYYWVEEELQKMEDVLRRN